MHSARWTRGHSPRFGAVVAVAALAMLVPASGAQTPMSEVATSNPVHIHAGSCAELGDVVVPLADVAFPEGEQTGAASAIPAKVSINLIDMTLQELLDGEFAINVHQSAEEIDVYVACGDVGGVITPGEAGDDELRFVIAELNDSGYSGIGYLGATGEQTQVNVQMVAPGEMG